MLYTRLNSNFFAHPKILAAGNEAVGAFARMLAYCAGTSDGEVPNHVAEFIADPAELLKLSEFDLIEKRGDGWFIPSYLDAGNPPRAHWKAKRESNAERQRQYRERQKAEAAKSNGHAPERTEEVEAALAKEPF